MWLEKLKTMKMESKKTTRQISEESGIPVGTLNKLFAGQTKDPKLDTLRSVVHSLGFTLDDLFPPETKKSPTAEEPAAGEYISLEESNRLLVALGFIEEGQDLSDDDLLFLTHIIGLLDAWFGGKGK